MISETYSLTHYTIIGMQYGLRDLQNIQYIGQEEQYENWIPNGNQTIPELGAEVAH